MKTKSIMHPIETEAYLSRLEAKCFNATLHLRTLQDRIAEAEKYGIEADADLLLMDIREILERIRVLHVSTQRTRKILEYSKRKTGKV